MRRKVQFLYSGIRVRNVPRSLRFYQKLGFRVIARGKMAHGGVWIHLRFPGSYHRLELNYYPRGNRFYEPFGPGSEFDHFGFRARDPGSWMRSAIRAGGRRALEFTEDSTRLVYVRDPDGNWLEAFGPARPRRRRRKP